MRSARLVVLRCFAVGNLIDYHTVTTFAARPDWAALYEEESTGGLLRAGLSPVGGFGRFLLVILALSLVANNIPNLYSFALTAQVLSLLLPCNFARRRPRSDPSPLDPSGTTSLPIDSRHRYQHRRRYPGCH